MVAGIVNDLCRRTRRPNVVVTITVIEMGRSARPESEIARNALVASVVYNCKQRPVLLAAK